MYNRKVLVFSSTFSVPAKRCRRHLVHREVKQMTNYEVMFIIDPALEEAKKEATVEKVQGIIAQSLSPSAAAAAAN